MRINNKKGSCILERPLVVACCSSSLTCFPSAYRTRIRPVWASLVPMALRRVKISREFCFKGRLIATWEGRWTSWIERARSMWSETERGTGCSATGPQRREPALILRVRSGAATSAPVHSPRAGEGRSLAPHPAWPHPPNWQSGTGTNRL